MLQNFALIWCTRKLLPDLSNTPFIQHFNMGRIHAFLDRQEKLELAQCSDRFGVKGRSHLRRLALPEPGELAVRFVREQRFDVITAPRSTMKSVWL